MKLAYDLYSPAGEAGEDRPPVILLHGRLDSKKTWQKFAPKIADETGRKVYALDARNHGESPWSDEMDFDHLVGDLEEFMEDHAIPRAVLVGHSMGGKTAIIFALRKPEKVEKLFVEDMVVGDYNAIVKKTVGQFISLLRMSLNAIPPDADELTAKQSIYHFVKAYLPPTSTGSFMYDQDTLPLKKVGDGYQWQANLDVLEDMLKNKSSPELSGVYDGEALFLYGNKSFFDVGTDDSIPKYFPGAKKVEVDGSGHLIHQDHPDVFLSELLKFISHGSAEE